ncbi:MAG: endonuclease/exonuclease/phosphatase family protein [Bacteroidales bacterium]
MILIISGIMLALGYSSFFINPAHFSFPSFFGLYFVPIALLNIILFFIGLARRSKSSWIPFILLLPTLLFSEFYVHLGDRDLVNPNRTESLKVMTYNVGRFKSAKSNMSTNLCYDNVRNLIKNENPDIVCMQEFYSKDTNFRKQFTRYPYIKYRFFRFRSGSYFGNVILSKYPMVSGGYIKFTNSTNLVVYSDIKINTNIMRIYNCHLESYNISLTSLIKKLRVPADELSQEIIAVHDKMKLTNSRRAKQVDQVIRHISNCKYQNIVCGDFNDTPLSYTYYKLSRKKKDSFVEAGKGFSATYSALWPMLRIDYVLSSKVFDIRKHSTIKSATFSDHYPITTVYSLAKANTVTDTK